MTAQMLSNKSSLSSEKTLWSDKGSKSEVLANIYNKEKNIVIWQRKLTRALVKSAENIVTLSPTLKITAVVRPEDKCLSLKKALGSKVISQSLLKDIENLVEMFCFLFGLKQAGLRLTALDNAMCPRFHVDRVPCRLLTTYHGIATEWIPHTFADRKKLGSGNQGMSDEQSGLIQTLNEIQQLNTGEVALLKGEAWEENEGKGLIHRSPKLQNGSKRLLMTLDFVND